MRIYRRSFDGFPHPVGAGVVQMDSGAVSRSARGVGRDAQRFDGWRMVGAAFTIGMFGWAFGFYGPPVYLETVHRTHGWSIALISGAVTLHFLVGAGIIANLPALYRRFGIPLVTFAGTVVIALGGLGWALAQSPWHMYAAAVLTGIGWSAMGSATINTVVAPWFVAKRPQALSLAFNGGTVGGMIFSPLWVALIGGLGFAAAAASIGAVMAQPDLAATVSPAFA
jgi:MFS family permease